MRKKLKILISINYFLFLFANLKIINFFENSPYIRMIAVMFFLNVIGIKSQSPDIPTHIYNNNAQILHRTWDYEFRMYNWII